MKSGQVTCPLLYFSKLYSLQGSFKMLPAPHCMRCSGNNSGVNSLESLFSRGQFADPILSKPHFDVHGLRWVRFDENLSCIGNPKEIDEKP
jgi:hypothetical protein